MCKTCGINYDDLEIMTIGMCLDYMDEYVERKNPQANKKRKANQSDFDSF